MAFSWNLFILAEAEWVCRIRVNFNTLYGNLYDPGSPLADENGFRKDYIEAMKELKVTNMRWPGGNFVMGYNWEDGIGPKDKRPARINLAWGGTDNNHVGTDEWFSLNKAMGSENIVCVNLGLGTIQDACNWLEYCNYKKGTYYSDLRIRNGHPEPYNVKIWDLGNEVDGAPWELGHKSAEDYVKIGREAAKAMMAVDNSIRLVASGSSYYEPTGQWVEWNRKVLAGLGDMISYISIHRYWENSPDYYTFMGQSAFDFDEKIRVTADIIDAVKVMNGFTNPIYISVDEWGIFPRNLISFLPIAQSFNSFIRHADVVKMADFTYADLTYWEVTGRKVPIKPLFIMFSKHIQTTAGEIQWIPMLNAIPSILKNTKASLISMLRRFIQKKPEPCLLMWLTGMKKRISPLISFQIQLSLRGMLKHP